MAEVRESQEVTKLPAPPKEVQRLRSMDHLAPRFRAALERMLDEMRRAGFRPVVFETLRTKERQEYLHGFGRQYDDGRGVVTQADSVDWTWHGYGLAVDIVCADRGYDAPMSFWRALGAAAKDEGLVWGGAWHQVDLPHVQWGKPMRDRPTARAVALRAAGGNPMVWKEVGAA